MKLMQMHFDLSFFFQLRVFEVFCWMSMYLEAPLSPHPFFFEITFLPICACACVRRGKPTPYCDFCHILIGHILYSLHSKIEIV